MGCCLSIQSSSLYPTGNPNQNSSSRAITSSSQTQYQATLPRTSTQTTSRSDTQRTNGSHFASHLNKPLRRHVWSSTDRIWTTAELERERIAFFDTRTSGKPEIWQTVKAVLEILRASQGQGDAADEGLGTAQQILDAAEITLPHSNMSPGVYDSFGAYYPLPKHILSDPINVVITATGDTDSQCKAEEYGSLDEEEIARRRKDKGKAVINPQDMIKIRVKLSDRDAPPMQILIGKGDSVRLVAQKITEELSVSYPGQLSYL